MNFNDLTSIDWQSALKPYQKTSIDILIEKNGEEKAAEIWLTSNGSETIIPFGATTNTRPFWNKFKEEFKLLICDDKSYKEEKKQIKKMLAENSITATAIVGTIASAIGAVIGISASILVPVVIIMMTLVFKMGINAYCKL